MRLTYLQNALVEERKVSAYLLSKERSEGKAAFFAAFGFTLARWELLRDALLAHAASHEVALAAITPHGAKYIIEGLLRTPDGTNPLAPLYGSSIPARLLRYVSREGVFRTFGEARAESARIRIRKQRRLSLNAAPTLLTPTPSPPLPPRPPRSPPQTRSPARSPRSGDGRRAYFLARATQRNTQDAPGFRIMCEIVERFYAIERQSYELCGVHY